MRPETLIKLEKEMEILEDQLSDKEDELHNHKNRIIEEFLGAKTPAFLEIGYWECKDSPIGFCFYDSMKDPALDDCLICGEPNERK